jgi:TolA protein
MSKGFLGSVSLHALVVLAALFGLPGMRPPEVKPVESIQVDISSITNETMVKAQSKSEEKPVEKPKPKASESVEKTKPKEKVTEEKKVAAAEPQKQEEQKKSEPEPAKEPEKKPEPKVEDTPLDSDPLKDLLAEEEKKEAEKKKLEEKKKKEEEKKKKKEEEKKKAEEEKKKAEEEKKKIAAEEKKKIKKLDVAELEELLNRENTESSAPTEKKAESGTPDKGEVETAGDEAESKATFRDALQAKVLECFNPPPASKDEGVNITVPVDFTLNADGSVKGKPKFEMTGDPLYDAVGAAAASAIGDCQPYNFFPDGKYKGYARWILQFNPKDGT